MIDNEWTGEYFTELEAQSKIGKQVRITVDLTDVPKGTIGIVLKPIDTLVTLPIQWELPGRRVDWFTRDEYYRYLEEVSLAQIRKDRKRTRLRHLGTFLVVVMKGGRRQRNVRGCVIADKEHPPFVAQARKRGSGWYFSWRPAAKIAEE